MIKGRVAQLATSTPARPAANEDRLYLVALMTLFNGNYFYRPPL